MKKVLFNIDGMSCVKCVKKIEEFFSKLDYVKSIEVSLEEKTTVFELSEDVSNISIKDSLVELGFNVNAIKKI